MCEIGLAGLREVLDNSPRLTALDLFEQASAMTEEFIQAVRDGEWW